MGANPTTCIWLSAREMNPAISFLEDLFVKVQCPKTLRSLEPPMLPYMRNIIETILAEKSPPDIEIVMWTRECVYSLLGLNLSTLECIELLFRVLTEFYLSKRIQEEVYLKCLRTIGPLAGSASYRTPLLLESVFLDISQILLVIV